MSRKAFAFAAVCVLFSACSSDAPKIVQSTSDMPEIHLTPGMATQVEMPGTGHVESVVLGNKSLLSAERDNNVVNLLPKEDLGVTNMIVRSIDEDGHAHVYQYRVSISER